MLTLIAAVGNHNAIGANNSLLWHIPEDMAHFRKYTMGKPVIMGRKTFESIGARPLPGRENIVVTSSDICYTGVCTVNTIDRALSIASAYNESVVIGGQTLYEQTIGIADKLVISHVDMDCDADVFFPPIDLSVWKVNKTTTVNSSLPFTTERKAIGSSVLWM